MPGTRITLDEAVELTRTGDIWLFRGRTPAEAVVRAKVHRLRHLATLWLAQSNARPPKVRFDVVSVLARSAGAAAVEHLRGAF